MAKGEEVFQNPRLERRWEGDQPIRKTLWTGILQNAGVRYRNPYQTRHTYASMMLSAGEHPMWVAKQMGHADWTMIARVYGRWMPEADILAGKKRKPSSAVPDTRLQIDVRYDKGRRGAPNKISAACHRCAEPAYTSEGLQSPKRERTQYIATEGFDQ